MVEGYFLIGNFIKTHGLNGELKFQILFEDFDKLKAFQTIFVEEKGKKVPFFIGNFNRTRDDGAIVGLEDVDSVEKSQRFIKKEVFLPSKLLPKKSKSEFLWTDIIGFEIEDAQYQNLGQVIAVKELPQQFMAYIIYQEKEAMFPLHKDIVKEIITAKKTIKTVIPEGLLEIYLEI